QKNNPQHPLDYIEIPVVDIAAAKEFYGSVFGWAFNDYGPDYAGIRDPARPEAEVGGLAKADAVRAGGPLILLFSDDLEASVAAVTAAGGRPCGRRPHRQRPVRLSWWSPIPFHRSEWQRVGCLGRTVVVAKPG